MSYKHTEGIFGEDVVQNSVRHELECTVASAGARLCIQHLELSLTLVELLMVAFLQSNACMSLVHGHRQLVPDALYLHTASTMNLVIRDLHGPVFQPGPPSVRPSLAG